MIHELVRALVTATGAENAATLERNENLGSSESISPFNADDYDYSAKASHRKRLGYWPSKNFRRKLHTTLVHQRRRELA